MLLIPNSAAGIPEDIEKEIPDIKSEFITNPYYEKKLLTRVEAMECISKLSLMIELDEKERVG